MSDNQAVGYEVEDGVAVVTVDNPPVNALGPGVREGIVAGIGRANADPGVVAIVLIGAGRNFIAGADIRQFGQARPMGTAASAGAIEASEKPVVAAIQGYALGGGLEHALGCHYRIGTPTAKLGLPETNLGIIPAGGGTQRLTRLVGAEAALDLILNARHVPAEEARRLGILDAVVQGELRAEAVAHARRVGAIRPLPRTGARTDRIEQSRRQPEVFDAARKRLGRKARELKAPQAAIACIDAALHLPFEDGLALERRYLAELENSEEAKALRYAFFAEREAQKVPGAPAGARPEPVSTAAVIGAGTMGSGIAICFAEAGVPVLVVEATDEALDRGIDRIRQTYAARVKRGTLAQEAMERQLALIRPALGYDRIADCDVVIEAVFESADLKQAVFGKLDAVMKPGALLLTNSSAIDIDVIASATRRPGDVAGAHFFAPANVMKLCEVVRGKDTSMATVTRAMRMARDLGKVGVVVGTSDGFAANRSRAPMIAEMMLMLEEGALPEQIDRVMLAFGYPMGPFAVSDLSGLDISYASRRRRAAADPNFRKLHVPDRFVEMGRLGQKTGMGWYRYEPGDRTPRPDPAVKEIIASVAKELGVAPREFDDGEILRRMLFASVNEACRILEEGVASRASDIDAMWLHGFGFPRHRGGLMYWADGIGAGEVLRQVGDWHARYGRRWTPSALLANVAATGGTLLEARGKGMEGTAA